MGLNFGGQLFPPRQDFIASYDYRDVETGTGMVSFYGIKENVTNTYKLIEDQIDVGAKGGNLSTLTAGATINTSSTISFDTEEFKIPQTFKGIAHVAIPLAVEEDASITVTDIRITHVHGTGGTTNLTNDFDLPSFTNAIADVNAAMFVVFNDVSATRILKGDKLRLTMTNTMSVGSSKALMHNPAGTAVQISAGFTPTITQLKLSIPFTIPNI